jgi:ketosteroid isomerase-like protein
VDYGKSPIRNPLRRTLYQSSGLISEPAPYTKNLTVPPAVEAFWRAASDRPEIKGRTLAVHKVETAREMGYAIGVCILTIQLEPLQLKTREINYNTVWRRDVDRRWRIVVDISTSASTSLA